MCTVTVSGLRDYLMPGLSGFVICECCCILQAIRFPPGSVERLLHIAAFAVSGYAATEGRTNKPFNPLLGETFELVDAEKVVK